MRYAVIADIHGNLPALQETLAFIEDQGIDRIVCLGDIVGYAGNPRECIEIILEKQAETVMGNHDAAIAGLLPLTRFNPYAAQSLRWTQRQVSSDDCRYLQSLPLVRQEETDIFAHASCSDPDTFAYVLSPDDAADEYAYVRQHHLRACFIGHTHIPVIYRSRAGSIERCPGTETILEPDIYYSINVGSVGQPRDGDPRACCCIYNSTTGLVQLIRLAYDIAAAQRRIRDVGLPSLCAERLAKGR